MFILHLIFSNSHNCNVLELTKTFQHSILHSGEPFIPTKTRKSLEMFKHYPTVASPAVQLVD